MKTPGPTLPLSTVERWLGILQTIARHPGLKPDDLRERLASETGLQAGTSTLYKDVARLKEYGLLEPSRQRQGYYLVGASIAPEEAQVLLNGLRIQAEDLGNPIAASLYDTLLRRTAATLGEEAALSFPVEAIGNRPVVKTNREEFQDVMAFLREPLRVGQRVSLRLVRNAWEPRKGAVAYTVYPLQFVYHDIAWYLLAEDIATGGFMSLRIDRLHPAMQIHEEPPRGSEMQAERLAIAKAVLRTGWGMAFPPHDSQGALTVPLETVELQFGRQAAEFIAENHHRHPTQATKSLKNGAVSFTVRLPRCPRVFFQFRRWVLSWGDSVEVIAPAWFRQDMLAELNRAVLAYQASEEVLDPA